MSFVNFSALLISEMAVRCLLLCSPTTGATTTTTMEYIGCVFGIRNATDRNSYLYLFILDHFRLERAFIQPLLLVLFHTPLSSSTPPLIPCTAVATRRRWPTSILSRINSLSSIIRPLIPTGVNSLASMYEHSTTGSNAITNCQ